MGVLDLQGGSKFQTTLFDLKVIGQLRTVHKRPYYVLSGVGCDECDANTSIYIHSPSDGPMENEGIKGKPVRRQILSDIRQAAARITA